MTNHVNGISSAIKVNGKALDTPSNICEEFKQEVLAGTVQATAALAKLKPVWKDNNISLGSKVRLLHSLTISIFLYACEIWPLTAELQKKIKSMEMRCNGSILWISYTQRVTNEDVRQRISQAIGPHDDCLTLLRSVN